MKKTLLIVLTLTVIAGVAGADSLDVNNTAALGGTGTACSGGNCGLEVFHDNTSKAYVQDDSPADEAIYRASFLFDPNSIAATTAGTASFRHPIFGAYGPNPDPGNFSCPNTVRIPMVRVFFLWRWWDDSYYLQGIGNGDRCGARAAFVNGDSSQRRILFSDGPIRVCVEVETGPSETGRFRIAAVAANASCPTSEDGGAWAWRPITNGNMAVNQARLGSIDLNNFGTGEDGSYYTDEFESFRTLSP